MKLSPLALAVKLSRSQKQALHVLATLADETGRDSISRSIGSIATAMEVDRKTAQRALVDLERADLIHVVANGKGGRLPKTFRLNRSAIHAAAQRPAKTVKRGTTESSPSSDAVAPYRARGRNVIAFPGQTPQARGRQGGPECPPSGVRPVQPGWTSKCPPSMDLDVQRTTKALEAKEQQQLSFPLMDEELATFVRSSLAAVDSCDQQALLDVLAAGLLGGKVEAPMRWFRKLLANYALGTFDPAPGRRVARERLRRAGEVEEQRRRGEEKRTYVAPSDEHKAEVLARVAAEVSRRFE